MSATDITIEEMTESLTGFDEIAMAQAFGMEWTDLAERKPATFTRALVFVHLTRNDRNAAAAKKEVLGMTLKDVHAYFADDDEINPEEPETSAGKDSEQPD